MTSEMTVQNNWASTLMHFDRNSYNYKNLVVDLCLILVALNACAHQRQRMNDIVDTMATIQG